MTDRNSNLRLLAGRDALARLHSNGFDPEAVDVLPGASGGPKWFVLAGLDRLLFGGVFANRRRPLHLIGSSIGAWRMACLAQNDPVAALERLTEAYIEQRYPSRPTPEMVSAEARGILDAVLGEDGAAEIIAHPRMHLNIVTTHCRGWTAHSGGRRQLAGFAGNALANLFSRRMLGRQLTRTIFHRMDAVPLFANLSDLPTLHVPLNKRNIGPALMASGSIPLVLSGVADIPGAPEGVYRDGGITDYHFDIDIDFGPGDGIVLYPHFYSYLVPGWFDKALPWRRVPAERLARVLLITPTAEFVARLPYGKIPDRRDFKRLDDESRIRYWRKVVAESERLGDELHELMLKGQLEGRVQGL